MLPKLNQAILSVLSLALRDCQRHSGAREEPQTHLRTKHHMCWTQILLLHPCRCTSSFLAVYIISLQVHQLQRIQFPEVACWWIYK